ncbi:MAG: pimeloyl-ACP methyl ester carboxylesterase [Candidatus Azotimanducaceae bacterium]|jgi:pimeloyl-ACP methyl ester carboxylesterase
MRSKLSFSILIVMVLIVIAVVTIPTLIDVEELDSEANRMASENWASLEAGGVYYEDSLTAGPTIVLIHGFSVPSYTWDNNFRSLANAGYRVIRYDLYGRGYSDKPVIEYDRALFVAQLDQLLVALEIEDKVIIVGQSMGGAIAGAFAAEHPQRVSKLVLLEPAFEPSDIGPVSWPVIGEFLIYVFVVPQLAQAQLQDFTEPEKFAYWPEKFVFQTKYVGFRHAILSTIRESAIANPMDDFRQVGENKTPTLIMWGDSSQSFPGSPFSDVVNVLGSGVVAKEVEGGGHALHYEQAELVNQTILEFIGR